MRSKGLKARALGLSRAGLLSGLAVAMLAGAPGIAAAKDSVTVSVVLALAAGEWSTEILAGANAAAKDLGGKVNVRVTGPTTFDPQRQAQMFLAELVTQTKDTYYYYHIKALNKRGVHVLDAVADRSGLHSISITERYPDQ